MSVDVAALQAAQSKGLVAGVIPNSGKTALRLEIDDLLLDTELANLYFLSLEAFMSTKNDVSKNPFSYYEISGIHGTPKRPWDNVSSVKFPVSGQKSGEEGYCHHGSALFPLWHRVYLAQFEQALYLHAAKIAPGLNAESVLERFRIPYWDPLLPRQKSIDGRTYTYGVPVIFTLPEIQVRRPENPNKWVPMANPIYQFKFPDYMTDANEKFDWEGFSGGRLDQSEATKKTIRGFDILRSNKPGQASVRANHSFVMETFDDNYNPFTKLSAEAAGQLWRVMLDDTQTWLSMSNHSYVISNEMGAQSLEGFHDNAHVFLAQGPISNAETGQYYGHMADPRYAGFDPSFWLHHCNIDRLLAIWQGIKSNKPESVAWWTTYPNPRGTFVEPRGEPETPDTPLAPFRKQLGAQGQEPIWWTSTAVRNHTKLGYDYPTIVAARQTGDIVRGLTRWANAELGWADPDPSRNRPGDYGAIQKLEAQIKQPVSSFPKNVLIDGRTPIKTGNEFISSESISSAGTADSAPGPHESTFTSFIHHPIQTTVAAVTGKTPQHAAPVVASAADAGGAPQQVLAQALPKGEPKFQDRFGSVDGVIKNGKVTAWNASFSVEKFSLNGSFVIYFFLGDFGSDPAGWIHDPHRAASSAVFASSRERIESGGCANCAQQAENGLRYRDTVGLTQALLEYWKSGEEVYGLKVSSMEAESIVPFLTRNLHWRVIDHAGTAVPRETIPSLKLGIYSETIVLPQHLEDAPRFEDKQMHFEITQGRPGGLNQGESL